MVNLRMFICLSVFARVVFTVDALSYTFPKIDTPRETQKVAVEKLITRFLGPTKSAYFSVEVNDNGQEFTDEFTLLKRDNDDVVHITGTSGVAAASGFNYYLKNFCNCQISWDHDQLNLPAELPSANITIQSPDRFRYYQNVCTYSYSYVWWTWARWEREIDWMALNGINLALAFTAQEVIWARIFKELNLTDSDLDDHFTGPAFLAWGRMANIRGWGGPLSERWLNDQLALQHKILQRMKNLGITAVLLAFCGHVPRAFKRVFPNAKLSAISSWNGFPGKYCCPYIMEPDEPLFALVGEMFYKHMKREFDITHYYNCDIFNELNPPNSSLLYLKNIASKVSTIMLEEDPAAVWIMQGWLFASDAKFWVRERVQHFLSGVPNDKMIVLDLQSELNPLYISLDFYFGKPFIWCMLHNFGGTLGMHGSLDILMSRVVEARALENSTMVGTGMTPEGINQNYVTYDFMTEMGWRNAAIDLTAWVKKYSNRRYGVVNSINLESAWILLHESVYNYKLIYPMHGQYTVISRPTPRYAPWVWYNVTDIATAWDLLIASKDQVQNNRNYLHDLTDISRQALQIVFDHLYIELIRNYNEKKVQSLQHISEILLDLLSDLENILSTNRRFMLGPWIKGATMSGHTVMEKKLYELNARYQITLWGPNGEIVDYACKQWSGMVADYYRPRWQLFTEFLYKSLVDNTPFEQRLFNDRVFNLVELPFVHAQKKYPLNPQNKTHIVAKYCHDKWNRYLLEADSTLYNYK